MKYYVFYDGCEGLGDRVLVKASSLENAKTIYYFHHKYGVFDGVLTDNKYYTVKEQVKMDLEYQVDLYDEAEEQIAFED